jgi:malonyl-CoA O-methyltransferase
MQSRNENLALNREHVQRRFDRAASSFDSFDFVHSATRDGLLSRLEPMAIAPRSVIDLGSATGAGTRLLARRFRRAHIIATDLSHGMLEQSARNRSWLCRTSAVQAHAEALPFADQSIDVVFANMLLPWLSNPADAFAEIARVLRRDGLLAFATLGPDSLVELRRAWRDVDSGTHVTSFLDMHDLGDAAVRAGLRDPVLDVDRLSVTYKNAAALFRDLTAVGGRNTLAGRRRSLGGASRFQAMADALNEQRQDGLLTLDLELVYGHCWGSGARSRDDEYRVALGQIGHRKR